MIRWIYLILLIFSSCNRPVETSVDSVAIAPKLPAFRKISFMKYSSGNVPMVEVEIQGRKYSMIFDLGSSVKLSIISPLDAQVTEKELFDTRTRWSSRGNAYEILTYLLEGAYIDDVYVHNTLLSVSPVRMVLDGFLSIEKDTELEHGAIGWRLFENVYLLIDTSRNQAAIARNSEGLAENGYCLDQFVCVPLLLDRNLVEFEAEVNGENYRCTLDTGSTWNYCPLTKKSNKTLNEIFKKIGKKALVPLHIAGCDMGMVEMMHNALDPTLELQVILGMEFIRDHTIVVDFPGKMLYFRKNNVDK